MEIRTVAGWLIMVTVAMGRSIAGDQTPGMRYPIAKRSSVIEDFHGVKVADPFRWLEDQAGPDSRAFIDSENHLARKYFGGPVRERLRKRLQQLIDYPRVSVPEHYGEYYVTRRNSGLQLQSVVYIQHGTQGEPRALLDPNQWSEDGTVALSSATFTEDGKLVAYGASRGGSDDQTIRVLDVTTGKLLSDELVDMRFSGIAWAPDRSGFWYNKYPNPAERLNNTLYWHQLGTTQDADCAVLAMPEKPDVSLYPAVTEDGRYLLVSTSVGTDPRNGLLFREIAGHPAGAEAFRVIVPEGEAIFDVIGSDASTLYVYTDANALNRKVVAIDLNKLERASWRIVLPETSEVLESAELIGEKLVVTHMRDVCSMLSVFDKDGRLLKEIDLPALGNVGQVSGRREDKRMFYDFSSFTLPGTVFEYELATGKSSIWHRSNVSFDPALFVTWQIFCESRDGTRVPIFVTCRRDLVCDGRNPAILVGYGGFGVSLEPRFNPFAIAWLEVGGVYAVANIRGGGEYGSRWHAAGRRGQKQNAFDDFIAAAQKLVAEKLTSPEKLAIRGGSNGGLLATAVMLQRPELFGAVIAEVPVTDMLRFQRFGTGKFWTAEYGDAGNSREDFDFLRRYSPLHNVKHGVSYPPLLVTTANGDDRVIPAHALKFIATIQSLAAPLGPYLLRYESDAGHGGGKPTDKLLDEEADIYAFLFKALRIDE